MAANLLKELSVTDGHHLSRIHFDIPPQDFFIIRPNRPIGESVQQKSNKPLPIFFGKLTRLFLNVSKLDHAVKRVLPKRNPCNLESGSHLQRWQPRGHSTKSNPQGETTDRREPQRSEDSRRQIEC